MTKFNTAGLAANGDKATEAALVPEFISEVDLIIVWEVPSVRVTCTTNFEKTGIVAKLLQSPRLV